MIPSKEEQVATADKSWLINAVACASPRGTTFTVAQESLVKAWQGKSAQGGEFYVIESVVRLRMEDVLVEILSQQGWPHPVKQAAPPEPPPNRREPNERWLSILVVATGVTIAAGCCFALGWLLHVCSCPG